jgi:hypothetical protein
MKESKRVKVKLHALLRPTLISTRRLVNFTYLPAGGSGANACYIQEVPSLILGWNTVYLRFSWLSSILPDKFQISSLNYS